MKNINVYIKEGLADWSDDKLNKRMDELTSEEAIKNEIIDWIQENYMSYIYPPKKIVKNKLKFTFDNDKIIVDYDLDIRVKNKNIEYLTNGLFQWGEVKGSFSCSYCTSLKTLECAPKKVGRYFYCKSCDSLKSLKGAPEKVGEYFCCENCKSLESLEGAPEIVNDFFSCSHCDSLKSLKGAPKEIEDFYCNNCYSLKSLKGAPKEVGGNFYCKDCGVKFTKDDVKKVSNVKGDILII